MLSTDFKLSFSLKFLMFRRRTYLSSYCSHDLIECSHFSCIAAHGEPYFQLVFQQKPTYLFLIKIRFQNSLTAQGRRVVVRICYIPTWIFADYNVKFFCSEYRICIQFTKPPCHSKPKYKVVYQTKTLWKLMRWLWFMDTPGAPSQVKLARPRSYLDFEEYIKAVAPAASITMVLPGLNFRRRPPYATQDRLWSPLLSYIHCACTPFFGQVVIIKS